MTEESEKDTYVIQIGAFATEERAKRWVDTLKSENIPNYILNRNAPDGSKLYALRAGPFLSLDDAESAFKLISNLGLTPRIVVIDAAAREAAKKRELEKIEAAKKIEQNRKNAIAQFQNLRKLASNDIVAQVLNYSIGAPENASGSAFFYPVLNQNGACIYRLATDKSDITTMGVGIANEMLSFLNGIGMGSLVNPSQQANWYSGEFDLNKFDLKKVQFYQVQSTQRNQYSGPTANLSYKTQVEGLTEFECNSTVCNIDRLRNGWRVLATKCKGTTKAF